MYTVRSWFIRAALAVAFVCASRAPAAAGEQEACEKSALCLHEVNQDIWEEAHGKPPAWWKDAGDRTDPSKLPLGIVARNGIGEGYETTP